MRVDGYGLKAKTSLAATRKSLMRTAGCHSSTWLVSHPAALKTKALPTQIQTSTPYQSVWEFDGNHPRQSHSDQKFRTWASNGTFVSVLSACLKRKGPNIWQQSCNGRRNACTTYSRRSSYMANSFMHRWSFLLAEPTSQAWKLCWDASITTLSYCAPHPGTLRAIWSGGNAGSANQVPPDPSPPPVPSATTTPIQTPAPGLGSPSPSVQNGEPGNYPQDGSPKGEISSGPRQSASSYSSATYSQFLKRASTSQSMETTGGSSKGGGKSQAPTNLPTRYSSESLRYRKAVIGLYTGDTSQALRTPQMPPHELLLDDIGILEELAPFLTSIGPRPSR